MDDQTLRAQAITLLADTLGHETTPRQLAGYELALSDIPGTAIQDAIRTLLQNHKYGRMPTPSEIREAAGGASPEDRAVIAWPSLLAAIQKYGYYDTVDFSDPAMNATVRNMGGWKMIAEQFDQEELKWFRARYEKIYGAMCRRRLTAKDTAPLLGWFAEQTSGEREIIKIEVDVPALPGPVVPRVEQKTQALLQGVD